MRPLWDQAAVMDQRATSCLLFFVKVAPPSDEKPSLPHPSSGPCVAQATAKKAKTVRTMARPGHTAIHGALVRKRCAMYSMDPHQGAGSCCSALVSWHSLTSP